MTCVYCLETDELRDEQVLVRSRDLYLCAPRGQLIEGYLAIAPYRCIGSLSRMPAGYFEDLRRLMAIVRHFYRNAYGVTRATFYEQGRAGGGAALEAGDGFPLHAHICCLPVVVDLHAVLARDHARRRVAGPHELPVAARGEPYVYVECVDDCAVYVARSPDRRVALERSRLKPTIATLIGRPERGNWRTYPGDQELEQLIDRWRKPWTS